MADRMKPHVVERVKLIRQWEAKNGYDEAKDLPDFKLYKNYYVPNAVTKVAKNVLSFGVGGNVGFEKELAFANKDLKVNLYDPTPRSVALIRQIIKSSSYKKVGMRNDHPDNLQAEKRLKFEPIAYGSINGEQKFYYDPAKENAEFVDRALQSFSLVKRDSLTKHVMVATKTLQKIMEDLGLQSVDIIKADIEGLWYQFAHEILENKIDCKFVALELELNFEENEKVEPALEKAQTVCDLFKANNYDVVINRRRDKLMLEMLFVRKDAYAG